MVRVKRVAKFSDFLFMVTIMAVYQAIYDASSMVFYICRDAYESNVDSRSVCYGVSIFFSESSGLASSAWSNVIILCVLYVAVRQRRLTSNALRVANLLIFVFSFLSGFFNAYYLYYSVLGYSSSDASYIALQTYSGTRLALCVVAFCTLALIAVHFNFSKQQSKAFTTPSLPSSSPRPFTSSSSSSPTSSAKIDASTPLLNKAKQGALTTLVTRLVYYPIGKCKCALFHHHHHHNITHTRRKKALHQTNITTSLHEHQPPCFEQSLLSQDLAPLGTSLLTMARL